MRLLQKDFKRESYTSTHLTIKKCTKKFGEKNGKEEDHQEKRWKEEDHKKERWKKEDHQKEDNKKEDHQKDGRKKEDNKKEEKEMMIALLCKSSKIRNFIPYGEEIFFSFLVLPLIILFSLNILEKLSQN